MTLDKQHILCAAHGAEFRIEDGYCLRGPCMGDRLEPIEVAVEDGSVVLKGL
jgi:nitrite reductase/ring-hydroxylating ferredoxin subunit